MTRDKFIRKWLGNPNKPYTEQFRDEMRDDLDILLKEQWNNAINAASQAGFGFAYDHEIMIRKNDILKLKI